MSTFDEGKHPRGQAGKFAVRAKPGARVSLQAPEPPDQENTRPVPLTASELCPGDEIWYLDGNQVVDRTEEVTEEETGQARVALYVQGVSIPRLHAPTSPVTVMRPESFTGEPAVVPPPPRQSITVGQVGQIGEIELPGTIENEEPYASVWLQDAQMRQMARAADAWRADDPSANSSCMTLFMDPEDGTWWQDNHTGPASGARYERLPCRLDEHGRRRYSLDDWGFCALDEDEDG